MENLFVRVHCSHIYIRETCETLSHSLLQLWHSDICPSIFRGCESHCTVQKSAYTYSISIFYICIIAMWKVVDYLLELISLQQSLTSTLILLTPEMQARDLQMPVYSVWVSLAYDYLQRAFLVCNRCQHSWSVIQHRFFFCTHIEHWRLWSQQAFAVCTYN